MRDLPLEAWVKGQTELIPGFEASVAALVSEIEYEPAVAAGSETLADSDGPADHNQRETDRNA